RNKTNRPTQSNQSGFRMWTSYPYHTFQHLVHPRDYFDDHPEWFPLVNGVRRKFNPAFGETRFAMTYGNQICTSNSEVVALIVTKLRNILSADASLRMVALAPNDNWGYCECENCKALDEPDATTDRLMSRRLVILYRAVARKLLQSHPKRRLLVGAYHIYTRPPKDASLRLPRNTWVIVCHYSPYCLAHPIAYRGKSRNTKSGRCMNEQFREIVETWKRISGGVVLYEYYAKDAWLSLPWAIVHSIRKDIPYLKHIGAGGLYTQWGMGTIWSNFLNYYIAAKLLWDASTDVDALLDEFYRKFYGNAAQQMKAYHETLERAFIEANICTPGSARDGVYIYTPDVLKRARMHIERALNVATDEVVRKRIEKQLASLNYAEMLIGYLRLVERGASVEERYVALSKLFRELEANPSRYRGVVAIGSVIRSRWYLARDMKRLRAHILLAAKAGRSQQLTTIPRVWKFKLDPNDVGVNEKWFLPDVSIADWRDIEIGKSWEAQGYDYDGFAWYRTMFTIPRKFSGKDVRLYFGGVDGKGWIYLNGKLIASHEGWDEPFEVRLRGHVKFGEWNVLVVRVYDGGGQGGIYGDVKCYAPQPLAHVIVGDEASERASAIRLRGFGKPEVRGGRICRNSDETGKGDNSAGWASFTFPLKERRYPVTLRMVVWGESDFSGVAVCTRGRGKGTAEGGVWTGIAP
ncbi:MAG TPA: DUF4838 domain-containing protein, partial [Armatimonadetes bacterium]|nr:DUF4838 domain-containing protein [Armatimonadota bacterium]